MSRVKQILRQDGYLRYTLPAGLVSGWTMTEFEQSSSTPAGDEVSYQKEHVSYMDDNTVKSG